MDTRPLSVEFDDITTVFRDDAVFHRLSLRLEPGTVTVLMGLSGAGKTTLIRHLVGTRPPTLGEVRVDGDDVCRMKRNDLRAYRARLSSLIGGHTVFEGSLMASLSVYDNVAYRLRMLKWREKDIRAAVEPMLASFGLTRFAETQAAQLSAHQKRRVVLARALTGDSDLLILDDIETGLNSGYTEAVASAIEITRALSGPTMLVTTHDLALARSLADTVAVLGDRRIVASGGPQELLGDVRDGMDFNIRFVAMNDSGTEDSEVLEYVRRQRKGGSDSAMNRWLGKLMPGRAER
jgi:phospholipid/cholesterol/gamma-HCH transport system ATP-binding protein